MSRTQLFLDAVCWLTVRGNCPDRSQEGLVHNPAALQPAAVILRQELAAERDRARELSSRSEEGPSRCVRDCG